MKALCTAENSTFLNPIMTQIPSLTLGNSVCWRGKHIPRKATSIPEPMKVIPAWTDAIFLAAVGLLVIGLSFACMIV